jgi:hypothetical protein
MNSGNIQTISTNISKQSSHKKIAQCSIWIYGEKTGELWSPNYGRIMHARPVLLWQVQDNAKNDYDLLILLFGSVISEFQTRRYYGALRSGELTSQLLQPHILSADKIIVLQTFYFPDLHLLKLLRLKVSPKYPRMAFPCIQLRTHHTS